VGLAGARPQLINTLSRWREGYHQDLIDAAASGQLVVAGQPAKLESLHAPSVVRAKEPDLEKKLFFDWYRRASLIDHIFSPDETLEQFYRSQYQEWGDFVNQPYQARVSETGRRSPWLGAKAAYGLTAAPPSAAH
jgi:alpha-amylase